MANKSKNPRYKEQGVKSVGGYAGRLENPPLKQPTTPFWNPGDLPSGNDIANWLNQQTSQWNYYGGYQGPPTPMPGAGDMPANPGAYPWNFTPAPPAPSNLGTGGIPVGTLPGIPSINPIQYGPSLPGQTIPQQYAPTNTGGGTPGNPNYEYWYDLQQNEEAWTPEQQAQYLAAFYGQTDEQGNLVGVGNPQWGDPYQVMPYWKYQQPTWIGGRTGGGSSMGSGRMSGRYYIPEQQVYKTQGGKPKASREGYKDAFGDDEENKGNNKNLSIPMWAGPLVNWRT